MRWVPSKAGTPRNTRGRRGNRRLGDTLNNLRVAASQLGGINSLQSARRSARRCFRHQHSKGQTVLDLDARDHPVTDLRDRIEQFAYLDLECEILER